MTIPDSSDSRGPNPFAPHAHDWCHPDVHRFPSYWTCRDPFCGAMKHSAHCIDDEGAVCCVCGLGEARGD